jgi:hypothetical protein
MLKCCVFGAGVGMGLVSRLEYLLGAGVGPIGRKKVFGAMKALDSGITKQRLITMADTQRFTLP